MIPLNELVLAYELRQEGCSWKRIALGLGVTWRLLRDSVNAVESHGINDPRVVVSTSQKELAVQMRSHGLGYTSIAKYLGLDRKQLITAMDNRTLQQRRMAAKQKETQ